MTQTVQQHVQVAQQGSVCDTLFSILLCILINDKLGDLFITIALHTQTSISNFMFSDMLH